MKRVLLLVGVLLLSISCNQSSSNLKTGYVDSSRMFKKLDQFNEEQEKFNVKSQEAGRPLQVKVEELQKEYEFLNKNARKKGINWTNKKAQELEQKKYALQQEEQTLIQQLQQENLAWKDSVVGQVKDYIQDYGKKHNFDYIYTTELESTVLYAKNKYDLTDTLTFMLNQKYKKDKDVDSSTNGESSVKEEVKDDKKQEDK